MARARNPNREKARQIWLDSNGQKPLVDIATELDVRPSQIRKWKSLDHWEQNVKGNAPIKKERSLSNSVTKILENSNDTNDKQKMFAVYYLQRFNATWAYMKAYGTNYETARRNASRLLTNADVQKLIAELKQQQLAQNHLTKSDLISELAKQAKVDLGDYIEFGSTDEEVVDRKGRRIINKNGEIKTVRVSHVSLKNKENVDTSLLKSVHIGKDGVVVETYDKQKAIDLLLKNLPDDSDDDIGDDDDGFLSALDQSAKGVWDDDDENEE